VAGGSFCFISKNPASGCLQRITFGEMSEEGSTQTEEVNSQRTKGQRSQSPIGGWSWNCLTCWRKKKPAPDPSGGALPPHWLDPKNKNFRTTWTKEDHRKSNSSNFILPTSNLNK
uniref:Uncharacterized protein n=1 Tax=Parascaris univalens TaxID=6257 RepID=A0A915CHR8_PARUN